MQILELAMTRFAALPLDGRATLIFALLIALAVVLAALPGRRRTLRPIRGAPVAGGSLRRARTFAATA